jgi:hypothetical protein
MQNELNDSPADNCTRRDFHCLALTAFGGLLAGISRQAAAQGNKKAAGDKKAAADQSAEPVTAQRPKKKKPVMREIHVCRGLNGCKGHGRPIDFDGNGTLDLNECAGQGACATAKYITCNGHNDCKRQGGCGELPGENECRGRGRCNVPLRDDIWKIARARFEARMKKAKVKFGPPPPKEKTPHGRYR